MKKTLRCSVFENPPLIEQENPAPTGLSMNKRFAVLDQAYFLLFKYGSNGPQKLLKNYKHTNSPKSPNQEDAPGPP